jgi:hypothetical protein
MDMKGLYDQVPARYPPISGVCNADARPEMAGNLSDLYVRSRTAISCNTEFQAPILWIMSTSVGFALFLSFRC